MAMAVQSCGDKIGQHGPKMAEPGVIKSANCKDKIGQHGPKMAELGVIKAANCKDNESTVHWMGVISLWPVVQLIVSRFLAAASIR